jgi:hypothetical protein
LARDIKLQRMCRNETWRQQYKLALNVGAIRYSHN